MDDPNAHQNPLDELKVRVAASAYVVDPVRVAEAILRRGPLFLLPLRAS